MCLKGYILTLDDSNGCPRATKMTTLSDVAEMLRTARREVRLSQDELALRAGVARTTVARMENLAKGDMSVSALVRLLEAGLVRAIGTSNFKPAHLQKLFDLGLVPHLNQIQLDPYHLRDDLVAIHRAKGIVTGAWRPLGCGNAMLADPTIVSVAERHGRTTAQVILRWLTQQGFVATPKSSNPTRMAQNLDIFDFTLSADEMALLGTLDRPDPDMFDADSFGH